MTWLYFPGGRSLNIFIQAIRHCKEPIDNTITTVLIIWINKVKYLYDKLLKFTILLAYNHTTNIRKHQQRLAIRRLSYRAQFTIGFPNRPQYLGTLNWRNLFKRKLNNIFVNLSCARECLRVARRALRWTSRFTRPSSSAQVWVEYIWLREKVTVDRVQVMPTEQKQREQI